MLYIAVFLRNDETGEVDLGSLIVSKEVESAVRARMAHLGGEEPHEALADLIRDPSGTNSRTNSYFSEEELQTRDEMRKRKTT